MDASETGNDVRSRLHQLEQSVERVSSIRVVGGVGITASVAVLLLAAVVLAGTAVRVLDLAERANTVQRTLALIDGLQESLSTASVTARAYLFSRNPQVAAERDAAARSVHQQLTSLTVDFAGDVSATRRLDNVRQLIDRRLAMFDQPVGAPQAELDRIHLVQKTNAMIADLRVSSAGALADHQRRIAANIRVAIALALFAAVAAPVLGVIGIALLRRERDSRRSRELQLQLMHVQRLAVMGETSTMLAHEINQPLTAAGNYLAVLRRHLDAGANDKAEAIAERIGQQIQRASTILRKLRRFIEKREAERSIEAPASLVEDALTLLGTLDSSIRLQTHIATELPDVMVDRVQMQQVLVNLMRNAIEAMEPMPQHNLELEALTRNGKFVEISLADSGPGLKPEIASRLFQPFVTSKSGGMGVGLSISRGIIEQHGGRIWAEPNPGGGAVFRFTLPAVQHSDTPAA